MRFSAQSPHSLRLMGSTCCRKETGKTITQLLKELDEQEAAAAAEQQEPDTQA